jgi:2-methylisocitrate lyase-like PEP mutase family enzyme
MNPLNLDSGSILLPGDALRARCEEARTQETALPFIGVYDTFSAGVAVQHVDTLFLSGYGFAASHYGLPDQGFIAWSDMVDYAGRVRHIAPDAHLLVDIDDGYGDRCNLINAVRRLERIGVSAVMFEDQQRPKKCGHLPGKEVVTLEHYVERLESLLRCRRHLFVLARTDVTSFSEGLRRVARFAECGADAVMVEGITDLDSVKEIRRQVGSSVYIALNLIAGGKTRSLHPDDAFALGVDLLIYSTPCLFAAQDAIETALRAFVNGDAISPMENTPVSLTENNAMLKDNQKRSES